MFGIQTQRKSVIGSALSMLELIYHATVRSVRKSHGNAIVGLLMNMMQTLIFVIVFYIMFDILGMRRTAIRGDFILFIFSGVFLYFTHTKAVSAVASAEGATSPMMKHAPMNTAVTISAAALGSLYIQILSMSVVLFGYHVAFQPIHIYHPAGTMGMMLLAWASGVSVGMVFRAIRPWWPEFVGIATTIYNRANMIASGKMFVANMMGFGMLKMFDWNPLFHTIDQARGFTFINYNPHFSSISYPIYVTLALMMIGLMGEAYTSRHISLSWSARR